MHWETGRQTSEPDTSYMIVSSPPSHALLLTYLTPVVGVLPQTAIINPWLMSYFPHTSSFPQADTAPVLLHKAANGTGEWGIYLTNEGSIHRSHGTVARKTMYAALFFMHAPEQEMTGVAFIDSKPMDEFRREKGGLWFWLDSIKMGSFCWIRGITFADVLDLRFDSWEETVTSIHTYYCYGLHKWDSDKCLQMILFFLFHFWKGSIIPTVQMCANFMEICSNGAAVSPTWWSLFPSQWNLTLHHKLAPLSFNHWTTERAVYVSVSVSA